MLKEKNDGKFHKEKNIKWDLKIYNKSDEIGIKYGIKWQTR